MEQTKNFRINYQIRTDFFVLKEIQKSYVCVKTFNIIK